MGRALNTCQECQFWITGVAAEATIPNLLALSSLTSSLAHAMGYCQRQDHWVWGTNEACADVEPHQEE